MSVFRVEKTSNFTVMSNHHLRNNALSLKAKGLLSLMLSLPDTWDYTLRGLAYISLECVGTISVIIRELEAFGYVTKGRVRNEMGQLLGTEYIIREVPASIEEPKADSSIAPKTTSPKQDKPKQEKPKQDKPTLENPSQLNTNITKKQKTKIYSSTIDQSTPENQTFEGLGAIEISEQQVEKQIEASCFSEVDKSQVAQIVTLITDTVNSRKRMHRVGKEEMSSERVKNRLLGLGFVHIEYVMDCLKRNTSTVKNIKAYLLTMLYNAPSSSEAYYTARVSADLAG